MIVIKLDSHYIYIYIIAKLNTGGRSTFFLLFSPTKATMGNLDGPSGGRKRKCSAITSVSSSVASQPSSPLKKVKTEHKRRLDAIPEANLEPNSTLFSKPALHGKEITAKESRGGNAISGAGSRPPMTKVKSDRKPREGIEEKRLRRFRPQPPQAFHGVYERATSQRFFVLTRSRSGEGDDQQETVELAGSTGNVYTVRIGRQPTCDCPHAAKGNQCKHVLYVMKRVLRAKFDYVYQLALLGHEVREIFDTAGPIPSSEEEGAAGSEEADPNRKPVEGDCPICYEVLADGEAIVWCKASCGNNLHRSCIEMWAATKRQQGSSKVTCPYCRSDWEGDTDMIIKIEKTGAIGAEGYRNVADQLGISTERGMSLHFWLTRHKTY